MNSIELARRTAERLVALGYNPLPSKRYRKRPDLPTFRDYWYKPIPKSVLFNWRTPNIQVMCGVRWNLIVIDLDGLPAINEWAWLCWANGGCPATWTVRTGSGGIHCWFKAPSSLTTASKRVLWYDSTSEPVERSNGRIERRSQIELLGDRCLVVAPPSIHVKTGERYRFVLGRSPHDLPEPAALPDWVVEMCRQDQLARKQAKLTGVPTPPPPPRGIAGGEKYLRTDVHAAMSDSDRLAVAKSWGLKLTSDVTNASGFIPCHAVSRGVHFGRGTEDTIPSASFKPETGAYWEAYDHTTISIYDLGVLLQPTRFQHWTQVRDYLGRAYNAVPARLSETGNKRRDGASSAFVPE